MSETITGAVAIGILVNAMDNDDADRRTDLDSVVVPSALAATEALRAIRIALRMLGG